MAGASRQWQHPHVDIFKTFGTDASSNSPFPASSLVADVRGDVTEDQPVSANNFIQLPAGKVKSMGLTGEYVYLLVKPLELKFFLVHLDPGSGGVGAARRAVDWIILVVEKDFVVSSGNRLRISLSNLYEEVKIGHHAIQCPCKLPDSWTVVRLHVPSILALGNLLPHGFVLRSLQLCASLRVRGAFTSDRCYSPPDAPRELAPGAANCWQWMDVPLRVEAVVPKNGEKSRRREMAKGNQSTEGAAPLGSASELEDAWPKPLMRFSSLLGATQPSRRIRMGGALTKAGRPKSFRECRGKDRGSPPKNASQYPVTANYSRRLPMPATVVHAKTFFFGCIPIVSFQFGQNYSLTSHKSLCWKSSRPACVSC
eukprot:s3382_g4.t1